MRDLTLGSSPLTRGKRVEAGHAGEEVRLIPAHAGKTTSRLRLPLFGTAHPRSRGENKIALAKHPPFLGSSPLTRGKQTCSASHHVGSGLIPAHAGKTTPVCNSVHKTSAHPRSRGENKERVVLGMGGDGSSPLTRGKHFLTCAFTAQIDQILETLELAASFGSYLIWVACATDAPQDPVRSIGLVLPSSRGAS